MDQNIMALMVNRKMPIATLPRKGYMMYDPWAKFVLTPARRRENNYRVAVMMSVVAVMVAGYFVMHYLA